MAKEVTASMAKKAKQAKPAKPGSFQQGLQDINTVAQEGNFKLFAKQVVVVALVAFAYFGFLKGKFITKIQNMDGQIEAISAQQSNEQEYLTNKKLLIALEPHFAGIEAKNEWLVSQVIAIFKLANIEPNIQGSQMEDSSNPTFTATSLQVGLTGGYEQFAHLLESIENRHEYVKVSNFIIEKDKDPNRMGQNKISLRLNTIFLKEKIANSKLFKDYDQLVAEQKKEVAKRTRQQKEK